MPTFLRRFLYLTFLILSGLTALSGYSQTETGQSRQRQEKQLDRRPVQTRYQARQSVPPKVYEVLRYVRANRRPPDGYVGGRRFGNYENHLPRRDLSGEEIRYQEWDVNPKVSGRNRGAERLVTGSDGRAWFTQDHYNSFVEVK
ncbi:ribonuclease domain-containing protein [Tellurirhabdus rosea]|uniref:ribonuclease domain-containing protein n=1 Tax=Tellurirhabdus rosea TaxID=2674997 RepID=UPI002255ABE3|nr:ribonuclease domain-containing protein [Tellurirhabdus rosea]